jgi:hypothetical protein
MTSTIWGYTQIHNAWPLAGLAIVHHLEGVADIVVVADHASTDETHEGLAALKSRYGARLVIIRMPPSNNQQAVFANIILRSLPISTGDWVFAFDSDEFLICDVPLAEQLGSVPSNIGCINISVLNHMSFTSFDAREINQFRQLGYRKKCLIDSSEMPFSEVLESVESLRTSYFDFPFAGKVIVRWRPGLEWSQGAHIVHGIAPDEHKIVDPASLYLAHFPMLEWDHLLVRSQNGAAKIRQGRRLQDGWQSQMVFRLHERQQLSAFWELNSVPVTQSAARSDIVFNEQLNRALNLAVDALQSNSAHASDANQELLQELSRFEANFNMFNTTINSLSRSQRDLRSIKSSTWWVFGQKCASMLRLFRK